jgi:hypothetical protein
MNFFTKISALIIFLTILFFTTSSFKTTVQEGGTYKIFIIQDSIKTEIGYNTNVIKLKKKRFKIELHLMNQLEGVYLNASFQKLYYDTPINKAFVGWDQIDKLAIAEADTNNTRKILITAPYNVTYLHYEANNTIGFDTIIKTEGNVVILTKTVKNFFEIEGEKEVMMYNIKEPLYLVSFYKNAALKKSIDMERKRTKIIFE